MCGQIDIGFPIGVHRADVAPIGFLFILGAADAGYRAKWWATALRPCLTM